MLATLFWQYTHKLLERLERLSEVEVELEIGNALEI